MLEKAQVARSSFFARPRKIGKKEAIKSVIASGFSPEAIQKPRAQRLSLDRHGALAASR
jgi:hypothetical protein